jgi:ribosomal protein L13E
MSAAAKKRKPSKDTGTTKKEKPKREKPAKRAVVKESKKRTVRRARRPATKQEAPEKAVAVAKKAPAKPVVKRSPPPTPSVISRWSHGSKERHGRGFSRGELLGVNLSLLDARRLGLPVDFRRGSIYPRNLQSLKAWLQAK